jgi:membrane-associated phospholipid phosphatase
MSGYPYTTAAPLPRALIGARTDERRPGPRGPLLLAGLCLAGLALVWAIAELVPAAHVRDAVLLRHFVSLDSGHVDGIAQRLPHLVNPLLFTLWAVALVLIAIARERPRVALAVALVTTLAPLSSEVLKPLLAHSHAGFGFIKIGAASYPSGHATAATILALCAVFVAPRAWRPTVAALGAAVSLAIGAALLIRAWHMPSDVLGGYLMALLWISLAVAGVRASERRWPSGRRPAAKLPPDAAA